MPLNTPRLADTWLPARLTRLYDYGMHLERLRCVQCIKA
jgi:hypothetical protein